MFHFGPYSAYSIPQPSCFVSGWVVLLQWSLYNPSPTIHHFSEDFFIMCLSIWQAGPCSSLFLFFKFLLAILPVFYSNFFGFFVVYIQEQLSWNYIQCSKNNHLKTFIFSFRKKMCLSIYSRNASHDSKSSRTLLYKPCIILIKRLTHWFTVNSFPMVVKCSFPKTIYMFIFTITK